MGEAVMESKLRLGNNILIHQYNLYGDPALNLWPTGQTLTQNTTISGKNYFSTNITVPSGITLTISAGSTLIFNDSAKLIVNGTLTANGGSASTPIKFNFITPSTSNGIVFNSGSSGTINYCKVVHAYNGIYENSAAVNITNSAIDSCTNGIYLYGVSPTIQSCNINYNTFAGIYLINSSPYLYNNYLINNDYGVYCSSSSSPNFGYGTTQGKNQDSANVYGVFCWNNSIPMLGNNSNGSNNNLVNTTWNVYNMSSSSIYGENNWWGTTNPNNFLIGGTGSVVYTPYCTTRVSTTKPPLSKSSGNMYIAQGNDIPLLSELNLANQYLASNNLPQARTLCLDLINNHPDNCVSFNALNLLKETYPAEQVDSVKNIYQSLFNKNVKKRLYAMAGLILADIDKDNKLQHLNDVINSYGQDSVLELALFDKFVYYHFDKNDMQNALAVSKQLDNSFTLGQGAIEAHQILGDKGYYGIDAAKKQSMSSSTVPVPANYALLTNYPNPFNPSTTINYQLPTTNYVTLKVYDILGREVKTLVNELQHAGTYSVNFDASKLASGVYFYQLRAGNFVSTKKMQVLK
jgi:parallel beta-helix repeat protein